MVERDDDMVDNDNPACPMCDGPLGILGILGRVTHYLCRDCGGHCNTTERR